MNVKAPELGVIRPDLMESERHQKMRKLDW